METFRTEDTGTGGTGIRTRLEKIEDELKYGKMRRATMEEEKEWKWPFKWKRQMNKSVGKAGIDKVLMIYLNIKGEIEHPRLVPLFSGNIIIYKNKAYEFDPRASWIIKIGKKMFKAVLIREIDRRPVSNLDWDEVKARGDATDSDEILVKMVKKAVIEKAKKTVSRGIIVIVVILVIAAIILFFIFGK